VNKVKFGEVEFSLNQIETRQQQVERELEKTKRDLQNAEQFVGQLTEENARLQGRLQEESARPKEPGATS
jgi:phage shock protein A